MDGYRLGAVVFRGDIKDNMFYYPSISQADGVIPIVSPDATDIVFQGNLYINSLGDLYIERVLVLSEEFYNLARGYNTIFINIDNSADIPGTIMVNAHDNYWVAVDFSHASKQYHEFYGDCTFKCVNGVWVFTPIERR